MMSESEKFPFATSAAPLIQAGVIIGIVVGICGFIPAPDTVNRIETSPGRIDAERVGQIKLFRARPKDRFPHDALVAREHRNVVAVERHHTLALQQSGAFRTMVDVDHLGCCSPSTAVRRASRGSGSTSLWARPTSTGSPENPCGLASSRKSFAHEILVAPTLRTRNHYFPGRFDARCRAQRRRVEHGAHHVPFKTSLGAAIHSFPHLRHCHL